MSQFTQEHELFRKTVRKFLCELELVLVQVRCRDFPLHRAQYLPAQLDWHSNWDGLVGSHTTHHNPVFLDGLPPDN